MSDTEFHVLVTMDSWIGNHEREITYWVWGFEGEYMPGGWTKPERPHVEAMKWAGGDPDGMESALVGMAHDEYGLVHVTLDHPYQGDPLPLLWTLDEEPTDEQWQAIVDACHSYPDAKVLSVRLMKAVTTREQLR